MGYETTLIIGIGTSVYAPPAGRFGVITPIVTIDLVKVLELTATGRVLSEGSRMSSQHYATWYASNGDTPTTEDPYGDPLTAVDLTALIDAMESDQNREPYRRFALALPVLKAFRDDPEWEDEDIVVLQYGH